MRRSPALGLAVAVLALAGAAGAKGPMPDRICGASGCAQLGLPASSALADALGSPFTLVDAPKPTPYHVIRLRRFGSRDALSSPWILARGAIRVAQPGERPYWRTLPAAATAALRRAAAGLEPYPASARWPTTPAPAPAPSSASRALLGISFRTANGALAWFDPMTLAPLKGRKAALGRHVNSWAFSADRSRVVFGSWQVPELRFVNARTMRAAGDLRVLRGAGHVDVLKWLRPDRLVALVNDEPSELIVVIDPQARKVLRRVVLPRPVWGTSRVGNELVLLLGSASNSFQPAQIAVASADGDLRVTTVDRIRIGTVVDEQSSDYRGRTLHPGFAVDPDGRRAFLVAPDSTVAEVAIDSLDVRYHELDRPSLFGRIARWLVPAAQAKEVEGPVRDARWLGGGLIAVSGTDFSLTKGPDGKERQLARAVGLTLVDTSSWRSRVLDQGASEVLVAGDLVIAAGGTYESNDDGGEPPGIGLVAYGVDGRERWRLHPGERRWLSPAGGLGYVYLDDKHMEVVELATGRVVKTLERDGQPWPVLLTGQDSMP